jgi:hypothetical protein
MLPQDSQDAAERGVIYGKHAAGSVYSAARPVILKQAAAAAE